MQDTAKYLIHADITAAGVVERSDVVGAVFGQTEGLLGEDLDLRDLQDSKKVGRIDVEIASEGGQSFGEITIASGLDRVETAILAASLETIEQVGPCRAEIAVEEIEDIRSAKRRAVVERATELLADFEEESMQTADLVETVRQRARVADITEYEGLPAGPRVADSDAIVVVEGRADVLQLLKFGVKNAIAVEGTDVPQVVADLTAERTVTAFLDGDRGGDLILKELAQMGDVDYVAIAPRGRSVEDLSRGEAMAALRDKVPYEAVADADSIGAFQEDADLTTRADGSTAVDATRGPVGIDDEGTTTADSAGQSETRNTGATESQAERDETATEDQPPTDAESSEAAVDAAPTLADHIDAVIGESSETARLLGEDATLLADGDAADVVSLVESSDQVPKTVVVDGACSQKLLDVAAQRGVERVIADSHGEYVKQPASVQVQIV